MLRLAISVTVHLDIHQRTALLTLMNVQTVAVRITPPVLMALLTLHVFVLLGLKSGFVILRLMNVEVIHVEMVSIKMIGFTHALMDLFV